MTVSQISIISHKAVAIYTKKYLNVRGYLTKEKIFKSTLTVK